MYSPISFHVCFVSGFSSLLSPGVTLFSIIKRLVYALIVHLSKWARSFTLPSSTCSPSPSSSSSSSAQPRPLLPLLSRTEFAPLPLLASGARIINPAPRSSPHEN